MRGNTGKWDNERERKRGRDGERVGKCDRD